MSPKFVWTVDILGDLHGGFRGLNMGILCTIITMDIIPKDKTLPKSI